jgi:hypothetical protein
VFALQHSPANAVEELLIGDVPEAEIAARQTHIR